MDLDHDACYRAVKQRDARFDGRFFTAVKTTGIYCRPVCPARTPLAKNVRFFPTAAAAQEAGFRPCLRCRPETAPDMGAWRGTSNTVSRGLALIELGALDDSDVEGLALRLGLGERQLRRLFRKHLGASPIAVAQTRRLLLAKQLVHETRLPMTQVAFAAGFGSIRRFNETFQTLYGRPPSELRRLSGDDVALPENGVIDLLLRYQPPYDWPAMLSFLAARAIPGIERVERGSYARTFSLDGIQGTVTVRATAGNALRASVRTTKLSVLPQVIARLRRVFDLAADPVAISAHLSMDPALARWVKERPGLRVPGAWDGFELAVRAVLGQQITLGGAARLAGRLVFAYGEPMASPQSTLTHLFPMPQRLASARLACLGMPAGRAATLSAIAEAVVTDPDLLAAHRGLDEAVERLRTIRGVGEWTAQYIALRQLREPDAFPASDLGLMRALADGQGRRPSPSELLARAERWRPWRAYAAQHLWAASAAGGSLLRRSGPDRIRKTQGRAASMPPQVRAVVPPGHGLS
jgi:AraC family transcriptional regulator, regulatory protein of adaptative response / DNA-3-methyladenine glycosylase II